MKINWKKTTIMFILAASLVIPSASFHVAADAKYAQTSTELSYQLTDAINVEVKSILNEPSPNGARIGAVVRLYNAGDRLIGVPEYEVRAKTQEGLEYIMRPSQANPRNLQPKETVELSYMNVVDRYDEFALTELSWLDVDEFVYPKHETRIISVPISNMEWKGEKAAITDPALIKQWDDTFKIPVLSNSVQYKPVSLNEQITPDGPVTVVGFLATNVGDKATTVADFRVNGKTVNKTVIGKRIDIDTITLDPGEKNYVYYAIPVKNKAELRSLVILTPEDFVGEDKSHSSYLIGRLMINLSGATSTQRFMNQLSMYELNKPIKFDPLSGLIRPDVEVSMIDLQMNESTGGGFKAVVAKFKLLNKSEGPVQVPKFQTSLTSSSGNKYLGNRQDTKVETLIPNISYVIYYSYIVPNTETGARLAMEILDTKRVEPYNFPVAAFQTKVTDDSSDKAFYPFKTTLNSWSLTAFYVMGAGNSYSYKLNVDFDIKLQDEVVADQGSSKVRLELLDSSNKIMTSKVLSFTGENKLVSGPLTLNFDFDRQETTVKLNMYEIIDTPFGEVRRLIQSWNR
ncbi:hypothetical protein [Paenibacillus qinlingensis]|uniref:hypothetical protein n=1 Tax=Paenibacillus qinlingensis TaxID=1837343 RepID=UPI001564C298|nr:hypothetical protein [Paenibacillus qinlingensis]NQX60362.1 hypothetical protein [Paenibacillus qinlingensis]